MYLYQWMKNEWKILWNCNPLLTTFYIFSFIWGWFNKFSHILNDDSFKVNCVEYEIGSKIGGYEPEPQYPYLLKKLKNCAQNIFLYIFWSVYQSSKKWKWKKWSTIINSNKWTDRLSMSVLLFPNLLKKGLAIIVFSGQRLNFFI